MRARYYAAAIKVKAGPATPSCSFALGFFVFVAADIYRCKPSAIHEIEST